MGMIISLFHAICRTLSEIAAYFLIQINKVLKYDKKFDYFIAVLFLLTSGSVFWLSSLKPAGAFLFLLTIAIINLIRKKKRLNKSWHFILIVVLMCLVNALILQRRYENNYMLGYIVCMTAAYLIISQYDFYYFVKLLTNVLVVILAVGIPIYILSSFGILPSYHTQMNGTTFLMSNYIFTIGWWWPFGRFSGIWHEPGACQIILNTILWLNFKKIQHWNLTRYDKIKFTIIIIGILLTQSTGGYLVFLAFLLSIGFTTKIKNKHRIVIHIILCIVMVCTAIVIFNNDVIQHKLFNEPGKETVSKHDRKNDAISFITVANQYPVIGVGLGTDLFIDLTKKYGNSGNSSGLLAYTASLGYPWLILFMFTCFIRIRRLDIGNASLFLFLSILMMEMNEMYIEYPITSLFIFKFHSYTYQQSQICKIT